MALLSRLAFAAPFLISGVLHLVRPGPFLRIMPPYLPAHRALVALSGICEIAGAVGLFVPSVSRWAAWGLIALLIAVFPANVYMATSGMRFGTAPLWVTWARLPLQPLMVWWAWQFTR